MRRTPRGEPVYRDTNGDGVIRPNQGRGVGVSKAMTVEGADEVVLLDTASASTASSNDGTAAPAALLADCVPKYGTRAAEAYWWSDTGIKYTFRWVFAVDYQDFGCNGYTSHDDSRYTAQLIAKRLDQPTGAYFTTTPPNGGTTSITGTATLGAPRCSAALISRIGIGAAATIRQTGPLSISALGTILPRNGGTSAGQISCAPSSRPSRPIT